MSDVATQPHTAPAQPVSPKLARSQSPRTRAREFALQAIYQLIVSGNDMSAIDPFTRELSGFHKCNAEHYDALIYGCAREAQALSTQITPCLDRPWNEISPIEQALMWMGTYEYLHCIDVPWRVVLNEYIELAKRFGGTDSHKYINGVLHQLGTQLRAGETLSKDS